MRSLLGSSCRIVASCGATGGLSGASHTHRHRHARSWSAAVTPPRVEVRDNKIEIHEKIQFDFDTATIKPASFDLMNEIAAVITKNPQIKRIRIEGYASSEGDANHNKKLSDDRAASVMKYLTDHGIAAQRLSSIGFGIDKPIADNSTEQGREAESPRRVRDRRTRRDPEEGRDRSEDRRREGNRGEAPRRSRDPDAVGTSDPRPRQEGSAMKTPGWLVGFASRRELGLLGHGTWSRGLSHRHAERCSTVASAQLQTCYDDALKARREARRNRDGRRSSSRRSPARSRIRSSTRRSPRHPTPLGDCVVKAIQGLQLDTGRPARRPRDVRLRVQTGRAGHVGVSS